MIPINKLALVEPDPLPMGGGSGSTSIPLLCQPTKQPEMLVITIPVDVGVWNDFYIEWEGHYLLVQVNDEEPRAYTTNEPGFFHTPRLPSISARALTNAIEDPVNLVTVPGIFQIMMVPK